MSSQRPPDTGDGPRAVTESAAASSLSSPARPPQQRSGAAATGARTAASPISGTTPRPARATHQAAAAAAEPGWPSLWTADIFRPAGSFLSDPILARSVFHSAGGRAGSPRRPARPGSTSPGVTVATMRAPRQAAPAAADGGLRLECPCCAPAGRAAGRPFSRRFRAGYRPPPLDGRGRSPQRGPRRSGMWWRERHGPPGWYDRRFTNGCVACDPPPRVSYTGFSSARRPDFEQLDPALFPRFSESDLPLLATFWGRRSAGYGLARRGRRRLAVGAESGSDDSPSPERRPRLLKRLTAAILSRGGRLDDVFGILERAAAVGSRGPAQPPGPVEQATGPLAMPEDAVRQLAALVESCDAADRDAELASPETSPSGRGRGLVCWVNEASRRAAKVRRDVDRLMKEFENNDMMLSRKNTEESAKGVSDLKVTTPSSKKADTSSTPEENLRKFMTKAGRIGITVTSLQSINPSKDKRTKNAAPDINEICPPPANPSSKSEQIELSAFPHTDRTSASRDRSESGAPPQQSSRPSRDRNRPDTAPPGRPRAASGTARPETPPPAYSAAVGAPPPGYPAQLEAQPAYPTQLGMQPACPTQMGAQPVCPAQLGAQPPALPPQLQRALLRVPLIRAETGSERQQVTDPLGRLAWNVPHIFMSPTQVMNVQQGLSLSRQPAQFGLGWRGNNAVSHLQGVQMFFLAGMDRRFYSVSLADKDVRVDSLQSCTLLLFLNDKKRRDCPALVGPNTFLAHRSGAGVSPAPFRTTHEIGDFLKSGAVYRVSGTSAYVRHVCISTASGLKIRLGQRRPSCAQESLALQALASCVTKRCEEAAVNVSNIMHLYGRFNDSLLEGELRHIRAFVALSCEQHLNMAVCCTAWQCQLQLFILHEMCCLIVEAERQFVELLAAEEAAARKAATGR